MRSAAAALSLLCGNAFAHPVADLHLHAIGVEHVVLFAVIIFLLVYAVRK